MIIIVNQGQFFYRKDVGKMSVNSVSESTAVYNSAYSENTSPKKETNEVKEEKEQQAAVYEKTKDNTSEKGLYSVNKMSAKEREALVERMNADAEARKSNLLSLVKSMMGKQASAFSIANGNNEDAMWRFLASGNFQVDAATKAQAQKDISEDGYWGVKQTSQRLFDFASALAGDDVDKMKEMQAAMMKGFKQATGAWGKELPSICQQTIDAANQLFDDYYASKTN